MKTKQLSYSALLFNICMALMLGFGSGIVVPGSALAVSGTVFAVGTVSQLVFPSAFRMEQSGIAFFALTKTIWLDQLQENLFPDNAFYQGSMDDTPFVINGKTVIVPQAGAKPGSKTNRTQLPAQINKRADSELTYVLNAHTTDPDLLEDVEAIEISYDKMASILFNHKEVLSTLVADDLAYSWAPTLAANIVRTSGTARAATAPSATGNRKALAKADLIALRAKFNKDDIPLQGRRILIPADFEADMLAIEGFTDAEKIGAPALKEGIIGRILGFDVYVRSYTPLYSNAATPVKKALTAGAATSDNLAAIAWHPSFVRRAVGDIKIFDNTDDPTYYGSMWSALVRSGGTFSRTDQKGVYALVEAAA